jgi:hypothetical protein
MLEWIAIIAVVAAGLIWVSRRITGRFLDHSSRINDYYAKALAVWVLRDDPTARAAALAAAKVAAPLQRAAMVAFLDVCRTIVVGRGAVEEDVRHLFNAFAAEVQAKNWTVADVSEAKRQLARQDLEYARALDVADSKVFERRYPELV